MNWQNGHVRVNHPRQPWDAYAEKIIVHSRYQKLKETDGYKEAKFDNDYDAAVAVVKTNVSHAAIDRIFDIADGLNKPLRIVRPLPSFDDTGSEDIDLHNSGATNAIPAAFQAYLCDQLDAEPDDEIIQVARVGRTKLNRFSRFLCQPHFRGIVRPNEHYMIVDDVVSSGGTFAALRSHIVKCGGSVTIFSALAHINGLDTNLAVIKDTLYRLRERYGEGFDRFWLEVIGHEDRCLTEQEAKFLADWQGSGAPMPPDGHTILQFLRDRLDKAASTGK